MIMEPLEAYCPVCGSEDTEVAAQAWGCLACGHDWVAPQVSVLLTSYNRDTLLYAAARSVLDQTGVPFECFVLDDDSDNPATHTVLARLEQEWAASPGACGRLHVYRHKLDGVDRFSRTGYGENLNRALVWASGAYVTYLTCDDLFLPGRLARMAAHLDAHPEHAVCYGIQRIVREVPGGGWVEVGLRDAGLLVKAAACVLDHNQVMHRRSCVAQAGWPLWPTDPAVIGIGDAVVWDKFRAAGWPFHRIEGAAPTDEHRLHRASIHGAVEG
jgi:spore maturation protein CgeD